MPRCGSRRLSRGNFLLPSRRRYMNGASLTSLEPAFSLLALLSSTGCSGGSAAAPSARPTAAAPTPAPPATAAVDAVTEHPPSASSVTVGTDACARWLSSTAFLQRYLALPRACPSGFRGLRGVALVRCSGASHLTQLSAGLRPEIPLIPATSAPQRAHVLIHTLEAHLHERPRRRQRCDESWLNQAA